MCCSWLHGSCSNCSRRLLLSENRCSAAHPRGKGISAQAHVFDATVAEQEGRDKTHQSRLHYDTASTMRLYSQVVYTHRSKYLFFCFNLTLCTVLMQQTSHLLSLDGACERKSSGFTWQHLQKEQKQEFLWQLIGLIQAPQHLCYLQSCITPLWRHFFFFFTRFCLDQQRLEVIRILGFCTFKVLRASRGSESKKKKKCRNKTSISLLARLHRIAPTKHLPLICWINSHAWAAWWMTRSLWVEVSWMK